MERYRFIVFGKGADSSNLKIYEIIDIQENLTIDQAKEKMNWFMENGYYQMAECKIEKM